MDKTVRGTRKMVLDAFYRPSGFQVELLEAAGRRGRKKEAAGCTEPAGQEKAGLEKAGQEKAGLEKTAQIKTGFEKDSQYSENQYIEESRVWFERLREEPWKGLYHMGFLLPECWMRPSVWYLHRIAAHLIRRISTSPELELERDEMETVLSAGETGALLEALPFVNGAEFVDEAWIRNIWQKLLECFRSEIREYDGTAAAYFAEYNSRISVAGRVFFHLVESHQEDYPFAFMATYSTKPVKSKKAIHTPLKNALLEFKDDQKKLLSLLAAVAKAADASPLIGDLMESGELFSPLRFTAQEAYTFLSEIPIYEEAGIMCRVPDWWRRHTNAVSLSLTVGNKKQSLVGLDAIVDFSPSLMIDGEKLTEKQLKEFLAMAEGLVLYKGKWVEINKKKLEAALTALQKAKELAKGGNLTLAEAMRLELSAVPKSEEEEEISVTVSNGKWMKKIREMMVKPASIAPVPLESTFRADLRTYQEEGYRWLNLMAELGLGACLADDMGLGKTVQVIAWLEHYRQSHGGLALLVVPASLIGNWQKELGRFAPELPYEVLHGSQAGVTLETYETDTEHAFLYITTYGMVQRLEGLLVKSWDIVILDEAQAVKNAGTKQTKAVKAIPSRLRVAMTGTPIENNLGDLWSLFDFLNKGLLGSVKEFQGLVKEMESEEVGFMPLKKMVTPFILRRLKTDRSIISDLPDKVEVKEYAGLSKKQIGLYTKLVKEIERKLAESEGIERKGLVLAGIMKFKQICNHPDQYLGLEEYKKENSGKFECLEQICQTIYEKRERVLVFTQFKEMTEPLAEFLESIFNRKGLILHGGTPVKKRSEMVEEFNGEAYVPYMVLSLKAGGVGLNLTAANHVVHFDRWWNPAVENQATDRAFRIGQTKNVIVHKFVTQGTIEEKIDAMIEEKQKLAGDILGSAGEQWITELNNEELMNLFRLGGVKA